VTKFIIAFLACVSLSACWQRTDSFDLHRAVVFCKSLDNIASIIVFADGDERVVCMDGSSSYLYNVKGTNK